MFLQIGDIHLEKKVTKLFEGKVGLRKQVTVSLKAVERVLKYARKEGISTVVIAGDLFDTPYPQQMTVTLLSELLLKYKDIAVIIIPGNHDHVSNDEHSLETLSWIARLKVLSLQVVMTPRIMTISGIKVWVCPHPYVEEAPEKVDYCIGHFAWAGAKMDNGYTSTSTNRPKGNWLLGDFHTYQKGDGFAYSGSLTQLSRREVGPKGFLAVEKTRFRFMPIKKDYHIDMLNLASHEDLAKLETTRDGSPVYWWVYQVDPEVTLPKNWQMKYPHILDFTAMPKDKRANDNNVDVLQFSDNPTEGLREWAASRLSADIKEKKVLKREVSRIHALGMEIQNMRI